MTNEWISVKDRLPQSLVNVSVFFNDEHGTGGFISRGYHAGYTDVWTVMTWVGPSKKKVTHWQPLPPPPK